MERTRRKRREDYYENSVDPVVDVSLPTDTNTNNKATRKRQHPFGVGTTTIIVTATTILTHLLVIKPFTTNALAVAYSDNLVYARIQPDAFPDVDRIDLYQSRGTRPSAYFNRLARLVRPQRASSSSPSNPDDVSNVSTTSTTALPPQHNQPQSTKIKLNHVLRFTAPLPPAQLTLQAGDALVLECSAAGTPAPVIHWLRNGKHFWPPKVSPAPTASDTIEEVLEQQQDEEVKLRSSGEHAVDMLSISSTNARLRLPCVDSGDGGDSVVTYACVAETSYMRKSAETVVTVVGNKNCTTTQSQPETSSSASETPAASQPRTQRSVIARHQRMMSNDGGSALGELYRRLTRSRTAPQPTKSVRQQQQQPAQMYMWTGNLMELNGNDARLMCRANGSPAPTITWTTPLGHVVERSAGSSGATSGSGFPKYEVLRSGDLIVRELDFGQDMGTFYCTAKNSAGSEQVEMFVYPTTARRQEVLDKTFAEYSFNSTREKLDKLQQLGESTSRSPQLWLEATAEAHELGSANCALEFSTSFMHPACVAFAAMKTRNQDVVADLNFMRQQEQQFKTNGVALNAIRCSPANNKNGGARRRQHKSSSTTKSKISSVSCSPVGELGVKRQRHTKNNAVVVAVSSSSTEAADVVVCDAASAEEKVCSEQQHEIEDCDELTATSSTFAAQSASCRWLLAVSGCWGFGDSMFMLFLCGYISSLVVLIFNAIR